MSMPSQFGYSAADQPTGPPRAQRNGPEPWRLGAAAAIVGIVVASVWLWGRPAGETASSLAAVTAEPWTAGQPPGKFDIVSVPAAMAAQLADPDGFGDVVASHDLPSGTFVTPALLVAPEAVSGATTVMRFVTDNGAWPPPGPRAGSRAVLATVLGGCAAEVATLVGGAGDSIVIQVDAPTAARLATAAEPGGLVAWPAPPDGWPMCSPSRAVSDTQWSQSSQGPHADLNRSLAGS